MATNKKGQSKKSESVQDYNKQYYSLNRDKIAEAKKAQYQNDPAIQAKRKEAVAEFRRKRKERLGHRVERVYQGKVYAVTRIGHILRELDVDYIVVKDMEKAELLPKALFGKIRCYTDDQVDMVKDMIMTFKDIGLVEMKAQGVKITMEQWMRSL